MDLGGVMNPGTSPIWFEKTTIVAKQENNLTIKWILTKQSLPNASKFSTRLLLPPSIGYGFSQHFCLVPMAT